QENVRYIRRLIPGIRGVRCRQGEEQRGALAGRALGPDPAPVGLHDALADGEAEAGAAAVAALGLPETVENMRQLLRGDTGTVVCHPDLELLVFHRGSDADGAPGARELDGIADQV